MSSGHPVVVGALTTARNQITANPNGTFTAQLSAGPVRLKTASGWQPIVPTLSVKGGQVTPQASLGGLALSAGGSGPVARLSPQGQNIALSLAGTSSLPAPVLSGAQATYPAVLPGTDLQIRSLAAGIDARLILHQAPAPGAVYHFTLKLGSLRLVAGPAHTIVLENAHGTVLGSSPGPSMWGAARGAHSAMATQQVAVPFTISTSGATTTLTVTPPASFLSNPAVSYPVTIDPSLTLSDIGDTYIDSGYSTTNYSSTYDLHVGTYDSQANVDRALLAFSTAGLPAGAQVSSATLNAFEFWSWSCTPEPVWVFQVAGAWNPQTVTWATQPSLGAGQSTETVAHGYSSSCPAAWVGFPVTSAVQSWANGGANNGLMIATNESNNYYWKKFYAANNGSQVPYISVTYSTTPTVPPAPGFSPSNSGEAQSLTPGFSGGYSNPSGAAGYDQFQVLDSSGAVVASGNGTTVGSGATSTWNLPAPGLNVGSSYQVQARAVSGSSTSAWSPVTSFQVDPRLAWGLHSWQTNITVSPDAFTSAHVNVANGELSIAQSALSLPGVGLPFTLGLWNTAGVGANASGDPARTAFDWVDSLSARLVANPDGSVSYFRPSGGVAAFTPNGQGGYNTPGGISATLAPTSSGGTATGWTLTFHTANATHAQGQVDTFNQAGEMTTQTAASGQSISIAYTSGQPTQVTDTQGRVIDLSYNAASQLTAITDTASGRSWTLAYTSGFLSSLTDPAGGVTTFTNSPSGDVTGITTPSGRALSIAYTTSGQVSSLTQTNGAAHPTWSFAYGAGTTTVTDPNGNATTYTFDNAARVTTTTDALGQAHTTTWTSDNNVAKVSDTQGNVTSFTWSATTDVLQEATLPTGATTTYTYANASNPYVATKVTDPQGNSVSYAYDAFGQVTQATDGLASQNTTTAVYQGAGGSCGAQNGQLCSVSSPTGGVTTYGYNTLGQLTRVAPPAPLGATTYAYTADGQVAKTTDGRGDTTTFAWNKMAELASATPASGAATTYSYDSDGNLTARSGAAGTQTFTWNSLGLLSGSTAPSGAATTYSYDAAGNLTATTGPQGTTTYAYNAVNEPTSATDPWGGTSTFSYVAGRDTKLAQIAFPNGVTQSFAYDASGRMTSLVAKNSSGATLINHAYSYANSSGADTALLQRETTTAGNTTSYTYDALDRLTQASTTSPSGAAVSSSAYGYDGASNRTSRTAGGATTSYSYNQAGELTSQGAAYDASGNLTSVAGLGASYNAAGQTAQLTPTGGASAALAYAGAGQNQLTTAGSTAISASGLGIAQTTQTTGTTTATTGYAYTPQGGLLAQHVAGVTSYALLGRLGSVLGLTNASGSLVDHYTYTPYGQQTVLAQAVPNLFGYDGGLMVAGTPLIHFGARYYDPALGLWTQLDPSGQSPAYVFAGANPVNYTDMSGLCGGVFSCIGSVLTTAATFGGVGTIGGGAVGCTIAGGPFDPAGCASVGAAGAALGGTGGFFFGLGYGIGQQLP